MQMIKRIQKSFQQSVFSIFSFLENWTKIDVIDEFSDHFLTFEIDLRSDMVGVFPGCFSQKL